MITGVHHVGQVVEDFERALGLYEAVLGATVFERRDVEAENDTDPAVRMALTRAPDCEAHLISREKRVLLARSSYALSGPRLHKDLRQTVRGTDIDPLLDSLLAVSPYHVAYAVSDVREALSRMERVGFGMYDSEPVSGLGSYERAFANPGSVPGVPFEFVELTR